MAKLLQAAAQAGEPRAQAQLGRMYLDGEGVRQNASEAVKWFRNAAAQDNEGAQFLLAVAAAKGHRRAARPRSGGRLVSPRRQPGQPPGDAGTGEGL